jgi:hypothetical protein
MEDPVKEYEVSDLVYSPGVDLDSILNEDESISLSSAFSELSQQYQAAAEYYLLLSQKFDEHGDLTVDVYCHDNDIVIEGNHAVLEELASSGLLTPIEEDESGLDYSQEEEDDYPFSDDDWCPETSEFGE